ncbi:hypothetical protein PHYPO_G00201990 [Pangasianodon hypophthalmus]|uniref:Uncharacterized protein n=1 Tax=Pangasianodon hypophthalmus TaxID=310915 RepID=A0A5N5PAV4_PANHP|nr:hypothetical protein PHYPO_G00201990 [Pangasianodon hypophthalmus]
MDIWCNGQKMETAGEFVDDGTETHFTLGDHDCCIKAVSSGRRRDGIIHTRSWWTAMKWPRPANDRL